MDATKNTTKYGYHVYTYDDNGQESIVKQIKIQ